MYAITGTVKVVGEIQTFGSGFQKREFVVTTEEKYPQDIKLELTKDKVDDVRAGDEGAMVTVDFNIRGNEYQNKYYVNLQAWKVTQLAAGAGQAQSIPPMPDDVGVHDDPFGDDKLPF